MIKDKTLLWNLSNEPNQITDNKMLHMHSAAEKLMHLGFKMSLLFIPSAMWFPSRWTS